MNIGICRVQKIPAPKDIAGIQLHNRRERDHSNTNPDIDRARSSENYSIIVKPIGEGCKILSCCYGTLFGIGIYPELSGRRITAIRPLYWRQVSVRSIPPEHGLSAMKKKHRPRFVPAQSRRLYMKTTARIPASKAQWIRHRLSSLHTAPVGTTSRSWWRRQRR